jgi:hypothetical protein
MPLRAQAREFIQHLRASLSTCWSPGVSAASPLRRPSYSRRHCAIGQPDHGTADERIRALFVRMICERFSRRARQRNSQSKFFKHFRQFAVSPGKSKSYYETTTYAWRSRRYSNCRSGSGKFPFEMSAEIPANSGKSASGEKFPQQLRAWECTPSLWVSLYMTAHERVPALCRCEWTRGIGLCCAVLGWLPTIPLKLDAID